MTLLSCLKDNNFAGYGRLEPASVLAWSNRAILTLPLLKVNRLLQTINALTQPINRKCYAASPIKLNMVSVDSTTKPIKTGISAYHTYLYGQTYGAVDGEKSWAI